MSEPNGADKAREEHSSDDIAIDNKDAPRNASVATSRRASLTAADRARRNLNAKLANPLSSYTKNELRKMGRDYALEHAIAEPEDVRAFEIGAVLAKNPEKFNIVDDLTTEEEKAVLNKEFTHRWANPWVLYLVIILCSTCAAVQGMGKLMVLFKAMTRG